MRSLLALAMLGAPAAAMEWIGVFALSDSSHTWSAQAVDGAYADPTMKLVLIATDAPTEAGMEAVESTAETLMDGTCTTVNSGDTMTPTTSGVCYLLTFSTTVDATNGFTDSLFAMDTTGLSGVVIAGQHVPTEFERDTHYLYDSAGVDVEPVAEEGGMRYAYFECSSDGSLVSYGEECEDDGCTPSLCGIGEVNVTSPACYVAGGYTHYATCASDGSTVTVDIYEDNSITCASDVSAVTPDQTHTEDPGCAVEEHDHEGDHGHDEDHTYLTVSYSGTTITMLSHCSDDHCGRLRGHRHVHVRLVQRRTTTARPSTSASGAEAALTMR